MYPRRMQDKIRKLEEVWERQERFFPSLPLCHREHRFPRKFEYYRYISEERLARYLERLDNHVNTLMRTSEQIDRALEWSMSTNEKEYRSFLDSFGWVLAACWRDVADLGSNYDVVTSMGDGISLAERVEVLNDFYDTIRSQLYYLNETIEVIKYVTSLKPKPIPFFTMREYKKDEVVVGICDRDGVKEWICRPYVLRVRSAFSMYCEQYVDVRPLSEKELAELPVDLSTRDYAPWMRNMRNSWVMPLAVYGFYLEHMDVLAEHWQVLNRSGLMIPLSYEALSMYFGV